MGVLSPAATDWQRNELRRAIGPDAGLGERELRQELTAILNERLADPSPARRRLRQLIDHIRIGYLVRWAARLNDSQRPKPERLARTVATHLLDLGYSPQYLLAWAGRLSLEYASVSEIFEAAIDLENASVQTYETLVAFHKIPQRQQLAEPLDNWKSARQVTDWLRGEGHSVAQIRTGGGFIYNFPARDAYGAAAQARIMTERLVARSAFLRRDRGGVEPLPHVWVAGHPTAISLTPPARGADVLSLAHEGHMYKVTGTRSRVDDALELAAAINQGPLGPAVAGGWAAIESLLSNPHDPKDDRSGKALAADRLAAIITCSWPRAELTTLAHRYQRANDTTLTRQLDSLATNRERCRLLARALSSGERIQFSDAYEANSEEAALDRMRNLLAEPRKTLNDVLVPIKVAIRRFYRSRNIVLHGGSTQGISLEAALRTGAPLIGAGLDRVTHAALVEGLEPLDLAARAEIALKLVGGETRLSVADLLERPLT
ncbi:MAG TPA: hypothetical protein VFQ44_03200 [Streptosporangiaceae bacterium]|nr:hypothetical protein [Streptosporangiaceae bacterium]